MADLNHWWSGDLSVAPNGDIAKVDGITLGTQRIYRRLMTAPGEYIFHPTYGAGLPQRIGQVFDLRVIESIVRSQIFLEACVARTPAPVILVGSILNGVSISIKYTDAFAQKLVTTTFPVQARPVTQSQQTDLSFEVAV